MTEISSADALAKLALKASPPPAGVTDVISPAEAYRRILDAWKTEVAEAAEAGRVQALIQVCEMLTKRIVPGTRIEPLRPGSRLNAKDVREWLIEMIEEMR